MAARGDPERIYQAQRAGTINHLRNTRDIPAERAEELVASWEAEAKTRGLDHLAGGFWHEADRWFEERHP